MRHISFSRLVFVTILFVLVNFSAAAAISEKQHRCVVLEELANNIEKLQFDLDFLGRYLASSHELGPEDRLLQAGHYFGFYHSIRRLLERVMYEDKLLESDPEFKTLKENIRKPSEGFDVCYSVQVKKIELCKIKLNAFKSEIATAIQFIRSRSNELKNQ